jgi:mannose-6-phosphate isomerase
VHVIAGRRLSHQTHVHRAEHWLVVSGIATCTVDDEVLVVGPGSWVTVPLGAKHRLANQGSEELVVVEIQRGAYCGEDDIIRLEDDYGRAEVAAASEG